MKKQRSAEPPTAETDETEKSEDLLQVLLDEFGHSEAPQALPERIDGVVVGWLTGVDTAAGPLVSVARGAEAVAARALISVAADDAGREVALMFEAGDPKRPMIMGFVQRLAPVPTPGAETPAASEPEESGQVEQPIDVQADGERVVLSAGKEIVLQCGKASITLTRAGKILIKGAYVLTRSSGVNRILGGSVQIN